MTANSVEHYLAGMAQARRAKPLTQDAMQLPFVTISRQAGAGGRGLAAALVAALARQGDDAVFNDWHIVGRELSSAIDNPELQASIKALIADDYHSQIGEFVLGLFGRQSPQDTAMLRVSKAIRSLASLGKVIIVGRGASQAAKGLVQGVHLRLVAPLPQRIERMMQLRHTDQATASRLVRDADRERARLLHDHFQAEIDDPLLYDAVWNTGSVSLEAIAEAVVAVIKQQLGGPGSS